jgi:hypothetical protein
MIEFNSPIELTLYFTENKNIPKQFLIKLSPATVKVFASEFFIFGDANKLTKPIKNLPKNISDSWAKDFEHFESKLTKDCFEVDVSSYEVMDYFFHYAYGFAEQDETESLRNCKMLFNDDGINDYLVKELNDFLVSLDTVQPFIEQSRTEVQYTGYEKGGDYSSIYKLNK